MAMFAWFSKDDMRPAEADMRPAEAIWCHLWRTEYQMGPRNTPSIYSHPLPYTWSPYLRHIIQKQNLTETYYQSDASGIHSYTDFPSPKGKKCIGPALTGPQHWRGYKPSRYLSLSMRVLHYYSSSKDALLYW